MQDLKADDPRNIRQYAILKRLGSGGMGTVYLARRPRDGKLVAVKVMAKKFAPDPASRIRFRNEIAAAREVEGSFTAKIFDSSSDNGELWYACEYIPGPTLEEAVQTARFSVSALTSFALSLSGALRAIHAKGIVHRDLKPSNIILGEKGVRVIDFGVAHRPSNPRLTRVGTVVGTLNYMAPEQLNGDEPSTAWDVFALGGLLVFAATGHPPFEGRTDAAVITAITSGDPNLRGVPRELLSLVQSCLEKNPKRRATLVGIASKLPKTDAAAVLTTSWMPGAVSRQVVQATQVATRLQKPPQVLPPTKVDRGLLGLVRPGDPYALPGDDELVRVSSKPKATPRKKHSGGAWKYTAAVVALGAILAGVPYLQSRKEEPNPQPTQSQLPEIELDPATFTVADLTSSRNPAVTNVEVKARRLKLTIKFEGSDNERRDILTKSCLKIGYGEDRIANMPPNDRAKDTPGDVIYFGNSMDIPGQVAFFGTCNRNVKISEGQLIGTNKVTMAGVIRGKKDLVPVVKAYTSGTSLKAVMPNYLGMSVGDYKEMCLKTSKGLRRPTLSYARSGQREYVILTFNMPAGTLYLGCSGTNKISYIGDGAKLP